MARIDARDDRFIEGPEAREIERLVEWIFAEGRGREFVERRDQSFGILAVPGGDGEARQAERRLAKECRAEGGARRGIFRDGHKPGRGESFLIMRLADGLEEERRRSVAFRHKPI